MTTEIQADRIGALAQLLLSQKHFAGLVLLKPEALAIARFIDGVLNDRVAELERNLGETAAKADLAEQRLAGVNRILNGEEERYLQKDLEMIRLRSLLAEVKQQT